MTALTYVLGAPLLKVMRLRAGRAGYWVIGTGIAGAFWFGDARAMALAFFSLVVLMGVFDELEESGLSFMVSGFFTLLINSMLSAGAFAVWMAQAGPKWSQQILSFLDGLLKPLADINPHLQVSSSDLMLQLPSVIVLLWIGAIYLSVLLERFLLGGEHQLPPGRVSMRAQLGEFRLPDPVVWLFIAALLGSFGGFKLPLVETVSVNVMNISLMLFFLQGLAVVTKFFETARISFFWQALMMFLILMYLFLFVAVLGLMDFWLDFRLRISKRAEQVKREEL
jgi:ABC-type uncharacterized transport system fused permease/ATPase subunit